VILIGGRQGSFASLTSSLGMGRMTFAYGVIGLFLAYLYFSLPRAIASYTAAAEAMDPQLEEAARVLGASRWQITRDAWWPQLLPTTVACGAIVFATAMGAFGTAFTLSSQFEVVPITIYNEFTNYANFAVAASLSIALGLVTWRVLYLSRVLTHDAKATQQGAIHENINYEITNYANFAVAASLSIALGLVTWGVLYLSRVLTNAAKAAQ